jgi:hypothetical protein
VDTPEGRGTVIDVDLMRQRVKVRLEEDPETISQFANGDIAVLRSGKAKKNDPPIPADLAPISGGGKRVKKQEDDAPRFLDPIRFRYSTEQIVEEPEEQPEETLSADESVPSESRRSRRRRKGKPQANAAAEVPKQESQNETPKADKKPKAEKAEPAPADNAEDAPAADGEGQAKRRRRPNFRRRRPKNNNSGNSAE